MALLGSQTDKGSRSYNPRNYSIRDLNLDVNGSKWPPNNVSVLMDGHYGNGALLLSSLDQQLAFNKEILKQTMLNQEAVFRDQIHELHRLYRRQRELMNERKDVELYKRHLQVRSLQSNSVLSQNSIEYQKQWCTANFPWVKPSETQSSAENKRKSVQAGPDSVQIEGSSKDCDFLESKCKKIGNKILDLQLPGDVYVDCEEESLEVKIVPRVSQASSDPLKEIYQDSCAGDVKPCLGSGGLNSVSQVGASNSFSRKTQILFDLNEPVELEEETILNSSDIVEPVTCYSDDIEPNQVLELPTSDISHESDIPLVAADINTSNKLVPQAEEENSESSLVLPQTKPIRERQRAPIVVQALPCFSNSQQLSKRFKSSIGRLGPAGCKHNSPENMRIAKYIDLNLDSSCCSSDVSASQSGQITEEKMEMQVSNGKSSSQASPATISNCLSEYEDEENTEKSTPPPDSGKQLTANKLVVTNGLDKKSSGFGVCIDLNSFVNEDEDESSPAALQSAPMDLPAPASPENKESSPPRGDSEENQLEVSSSDENQPEISFQLENGDLKENLVSIAAEAIVTISSSSQIETRQVKDNVTCEPAEIPWIESLHWFAKVVSSVVDNPESDSGVALPGKDSNNRNHEDSLPDGMDYFEAMTLKLTQMKAEDYLCKITIQKEEETQPISLPTQSQPKRGRTRSARQQRKDFQKEILPSLASLSRCEVTEDLQTIGGLIEASVTCSGSCRYPGKNMWTRGRKRACFSSSKARESTDNLLSKQQACNNEIVTEERSLVDWGKIKRRRRGQRCPSANLRPIVGQV